MAKRTTKSRQELLEMYGPQVKVKKAQLPTYIEVQNRHLERHPNVDGNCGVCKELVNGVEQPQAYPCASLQRVGLG